MKWVNLWSLSVEYLIEDLFSAFGMCHSLLRFIYWRIITPAIPFRALSHQEDLQSRRKDARLPSIIALQSLFIPLELYLPNAKRKCYWFGSEWGDFSGEVWCKKPTLVSEHPEHFSVGSSRLLLMYSKVFCFRWIISWGTIFPATLLEVPFFKRIFDCRINVLRVGHCN